MPRALAVHHMLATRSLVIVTCVTALGGMVRADDAGPRVDVVVGRSAARLERLAAEELAVQFRHLFGADVRITETSTAVDPPTVLLGNPESNPAIREVLGAAWPKLSDQGLLIKSIERNGQAALIVGGNTPVGTLWAVYELGHRLGVRYLLSGDVYPVLPPSFELSGFDIVAEPTLPARSWRTIHALPMGPEAWGLAEHRRVLRQLAKLKFNRIVLSVHPWQPFVDYEFRGVKKQTAMLWYGWRFALDGDTAGRAVFRGAREFYNPDLANKHSYEELTEAGIALARGVIESARELGMSTALCLTPLEFPKEFAASLPDARVQQGPESLTIGPGPHQPPDDPLLLELAKTQLRAYLTTYPQIDALYLTMPEFPDWVAHYRQAWQSLTERSKSGSKIPLEALLEAARDRTGVASGEQGVRGLQGSLSALDCMHRLLADRELLTRADGKKIETHLVGLDPALFPVAADIVPPDTDLLHVVDDTARRAAEHRQRLADLKAAAAGGRSAGTSSPRHSLVLTLADDNVGFLPQSAITPLHTLVDDIRSRGWEGYSTQYGQTVDLDYSLQYISRASWDIAADPQAVLDNLVTPMCGAGVTERVALAFSLIEQATRVIDEHDQGFAYPAPNVVMKHYGATEAPPAWWTETSGLYASAMNEMYRAHDRAHPRGRPYLRYFCKRLEFAIEHLASIDALRRAGAAKAQGNQTEQIAQLERAVESMYNALSALSEVARDSGDLGTIAMLNEFGYRPLQQALAEAESR